LRQVQSQVQKRRRLEIKKRLFSRKKESAYPFDGNGDKGSFKPVPIAVDPYFTTNAL
jgi:hypothetical protein